MKGYGLALFVSVSLAITGACGSKSNKTQPADDAGAGGTKGTEPAEPVVEPRIMGKAELTQYAYSRGPGRKAFRTAVEADGKEDWAASEKACRETLLIDPGHLSANWLLALALAAQGKNTEALEPLSAAVAGDWMRWGTRSLETDNLATFRASPAGRAYSKLAAIYRDNYQRSLATGLLVVGRRGKAWAPRRKGVTLINHRSEIYAYDVGTGRYLRVSRTNAALVGFVRSPQRGQLAYASYRRVWLPTESQAKAGAVPYIRELRVGTIDLGGARMSAKETVFENVYAADIRYASVDGMQQLQIRIRAMKSSGNSPMGGRETFVANPEQGTKVAGEWGPTGGDVLHVQHGFADLRRSADSDVTADWDEEGAAGSFRLSPTRKTITVPSGDRATRNSLRWSPSRARLVFATQAIDPCSTDAAERVARLYVVDAASGRLHPVAVGDGPFDATWLDDSQLAYVDRQADSVAVHLIDVDTGAQRVSLETPGGLGTERLSALVRCIDPEVQRRNESDSYSEDPDDGGEDEWEGDRPQDRDSDAKSGSSAATDPPVGEPSD